MTSVKDGVSGVLIDLSEDVTCFSEIISSWIQDLDHYNRLCQGARLHYEMNGNWKVLIKRFTDHVEEKIDFYKNHLKKNSFQ